MLSDAAQYTSVQLIFIEITFGGATINFSVSEIKFKRLK
jgi:hypothetical protein